MRTSASFAVAQCMQAARHARDMNQDLEKFAAGVLPFPKELIPQPLGRDKCSICWFNKPAS
eukprot:4212885-Pyramimonas_sp.AAC.1